MRIARTECRLAPATGHHVTATVLTGFGRPFGLAMDTAGRLHVADMDLHAVLRFSADLDRVYVIGSAKHEDDSHATVEGVEPAAPPAPPGPLNGPHAVDIAADGRLYVTTYYEPGIHVFDTNGKAAFHFGRDSSGIHLAGPATAFFDSGQRLLVAEYKHDAILAFSPDGRYRGGLGWFGDGPARFAREESFTASGQPGGFDRPHMCRESPDGDLVVADTWNHRLQRFSRDGEWLAWMGGSDDAAGPAWRREATQTSAGNAPGRFNAPVAISWSQSGALLVTDWGNNRLQQFDANGQSSRMIDGIGLNRPYDAQFFGPMLYIADSHNGRVICLDAAWLA